MQPLRWVAGSRGTPSENEGRKLGLRRQLIFRGLAILLGIGLVLALEAGLRLTPWGRIADAGDPYVGFSDVLPLFVLNADGTQYEIPKSRQVFFRPETFAANKGANEFRIFCLGGSTVQGRPYAKETSFTTWLELTLKASEPSKDWQVINCGGVSYASYRLVPIMKELLQHQPDLFLVYTGHNEFLEERTYAHIKNEPRWITALRQQAMPFRIYGVAHGWLKSQPEPVAPVRLRAEVDALLDYQGGLAQYRRDDVWHAGVVRHYEHNLHRMVTIARGAGIPLLLANPVSNVRDTPPFKVEIDGSLSAEQQAEVKRLWEQAKASEWQDLAAKESLVQQVLTLDRRHAEAHFLMGRIQETKGNWAAAERHYLRAKDEDICPLRMTEPMHGIVRSVARSTGTPLIDVRSLFESLAEHGIPGDDLLIDHVHPRIEGHQRIAQEVVQQMRQSGTLDPQPGWEARQKEWYDANLRELPSNYFPESLERLRGLQRWTRGRVNRLRLD